MSVGDLARRGERAHAPSLKGWTLLLNWRAVLGRCRLYGRDLGLAVQEVFDPDGVGGDRQMVAERTHCDCAQKDGYADLGLDDHPEFSVNHADSP